jgi:hypothetical protein
MSADGAHSTVIEAPGVLELDVTDVVDRWLYQGMDNHGFLMGTGDTISDKPGAGSWTLAFGASEGDQDKRPALIIDMVGTPPTPETIAERTLGGITETCV